MSFFFFPIRSWRFEGDSLESFLTLPFFKLFVDLSLIYFGFASTVLLDLLLLFSQFFYIDLRAESFFWLRDFSTVLDFFRISLREVALGNTFFLWAFLILCPRGADILLWILRRLGFFSLLSSSWMRFMYVNYF